MSDGGSIQAKAITGVYEETGNGSIEEKPIRPFYRKTVDVGPIRGEAMAGL